MCRFASSVETIFWSLFGEINHGNFMIDGKEYFPIRKTGVILYGAFDIVAVLVS